MTTKLGGRKYKDAKITEGFNQDKIGVTKEVMAQAKRAVAAQKKLSAKPKRSYKKKPPVGRPDTNSTITGYDAEGWPIFAPDAPIDIVLPIPLVPDEDEDDYPIAVGSRNRMTGYYH